MADGPNFEATDKAAGIFLGTPLLAGFAVLCIALFCPGTAPYEDRATVIPIAIGVGTAGLIGSLLYVRWRRRRKRALSLESMARIGALRLQPHQQTSQMVEISSALADNFLLVPQGCVLPNPSQPITVAQIADAVFNVMQRLESEGESLINPAGIKTATTFVADYTDSNPKDLQMVTPLAAVVPMMHRNEMWRAAKERSSVPLPKLAVTSWATGLAMILCLVITFGITVPLTQWLDRTHPVRDPNPVLKTIAKVVVRGGFFGILLGSGAALILLFRRLFPTFPQACRTIGHLAAYLAPPKLQDASSLRQPWTREQVLAEVKSIVATEMRVDKIQIRSTTACT